MKTVRKVMLIGIDGATLSLLEPWANDGQLPTVRKLMQAGSFGELRTTFPPITPSAWTSFMTGTNPGRHGIFEFFRRDQGSYRLRPTGSSMRTGVTLWRTLSEAGKRVGVVNVPLTYPPEKVNGFMISGLLTPFGATDYCFPPELLDEIESKFGKYRLHHTQVRSRGGIEKFLKDQYDILEYRTQVARYLMTRYDWNFLMVHFYGPDQIQHELWHILDPSHPQYDEKARKRYGNVVLDYFRSFDVKLMQIMEQIGDDTVLILMSDHGFGPSHYYINLNTWLLKLGYIKLKDNLSTNFKHLLFRCGITPSSAYRLMLMTPLARLRRSMNVEERYKLLQKLFLSYGNIDWSATRAYSMGNHGEIYINLKGREPLGVVAPGTEYEALMSELTARLMELVDERTGDKVIEKVMRRDELYCGEHTEEAPDLMFLTREMKYVAMGISEFSSNSVIEPVFGHTGNHRMEGLIILWGPSIRRGMEIAGARITDVAPTILHLLDVPIPGDMDGKPLKEALEPEFLRSHPPRFMRFEQEEPAKKRVDYTEQEEEAIRRHLRDLGYLS
jgi:predicted AlkP superfamily phosphohydrolase/phosphomutase